MSSILVQASVTGGAYSGGKRTVVVGDTVQFRLDPQYVDGVSIVLWEIYEAPTGYTTPAGWTADATGLAWSYVATAGTGLMPPLVDLAGDPWGKYLIRATANNGVMGGAVTTDAVDESCCLVMVSSAGIENVAALETDQSDPRGALAIVKQAIEDLEPFIPPAGALAGDIAIADGAGGWTSGDPAIILRTGYDFHVANISVPNDGVGTGYTTILTTTRAALFSATQRARPIAIVLAVRKYAAAASDPIDFVFATVTMTRRDAGTDTLVTDAGTVDSSTPASITGTLTLPAAAQVLGYRFRCGSGGTLQNVYLEIRRDIAQDRYVEAWLYLDNEYTIA
jgi:hypothetical protein